MKSPAKKSPAVKKTATVAKKAAPAASKVSKASPAKKAAVKKVTEPKAPAKKATKSASNKKMTPKAKAKASASKAAATAKTMEKRAKTSKVSATIVDQVLTPPVAKSKVMPEGVLLAAKTIFSLRALDVKVVDLRGLSDVADYYVVGTCSSEAQMQAILTALQRAFKTAKISSLGIEYRAGVRWAVFDAIDVMIHLFEETARTEYALERLWKDGVVTDLVASDYIKDTVGVDQGNEFI